MAVPFIRKYLAFGLVGGFTYVVLHFTIYLINPERIIDPFLKLIPIIPVILSMLYAIQFRINKSKLDDLVYRDLVQSSFITFIVMETLYVAYTYLLYNQIHVLIFPDAATLDEVLKVALIKSETLRYDQLGGVPKQKYEMMIAHIQAEDYTFPIDRALKGLFQWYIIGFGFSFLLAMFGMNRVKSLRNG